MPLRYPISVVYSNSIHHRYQGLFFIQGLVILLYLSTGMLFIVTKSCFAQDVFPERFVLWGWYDSYETLASKHPTENGIVPVKKCNVIDVSGAWEQLSCASDVSKYILIVLHVSFHNVSFMSPW